MTDSNIITKTANWNALNGSVGKMFYSQIYCKFEVNGVCSYEVYEVWLKFLLYYYILFCEFEVNEVFVWSLWSMAEVVFYIITFYSVSSKFIDFGSIRQHSLHHFLSWSFNLIKNC